MHAGQCDPKNFDHRDMLFCTYIDKMNVKAPADVNTNICKYAYAYTHIHTCTLVMPRYDQDIIMTSQYSTEFISQ